MNKIVAVTLLLAFAEQMAAQTSTTASTTLLYSQPSAAETYVAAPPGATLARVDGNGLTFHNGNGHYTLVTAPGIVYQQAGQWLPSQVQVAQASDGTGWQLLGTSLNVAFTAPLDGEMPPAPDGLTADVCPKTGNGEC